MNQKKSNTEYFLADTTGVNDEVVDAGITWLSNKGGGCIFTQNKGTMRNALNVNTDNELKGIERELSSLDIVLNWSNRSISHTVLNLMAVYADTTIDIKIKSNDFERVLIIPWTKEEADWFKAAYKPVIVTVNTNGKLVKVKNQPSYISVKDEIPEALNQILVRLARCAAGYDNNLQRQERERFKTNLMNHPVDWKQIDPETAFIRCAELGMSAKDSREISKMIRQLRDGYRFDPRPGFEKDSTAN